MKSFSYIVAVLALIVSIAQSADSRAWNQPRKIAKTLNNVECVIQAFGSDLEDKGIVVEVRDPGFSCGPISSTPISNSADFVGGEAEVALTLPAENFHICTSGIVIAVTLPYSCHTIERSIDSVYWGGVPQSFGDCRALEQKCGSTISAAAIPYIDMWCRRAASEGGEAEGMILNWSSQQANDKC